MEGVVAAAAEFLQDAQAVEAALEVDRARAAHTGALRFAFEGFRDGGDSLGRLVGRLRGPLWEERDGPDGEPSNVWGFQNEDERLFAERLATAARKHPDLELDDELRRYLQEGPGDSTAQRVQLLVAWGELVGGLDARAPEGEPRLGVGPAASFLSFAWQCLTDGREPVLHFTASKAVRRVLETGGLGPDARPSRELQPRIEGFYRVADAVARGTRGAPAGMAPGWAVEHALAWLLGRIERLVAAGDEAGLAELWRPRRPASAPPASGATPRPLIVGPAGGDAAGPAGGPTIVRPRGEPASEPPAPPPPPAEASRPSPPSPPRAAAPTPEPGPADPGPAGPTPATDARPAAPRPAAPATDPGGAEPRRAKTERFDRISRISRSKVTQTETPVVIERTGVDFADALPPDRTPPVGMPRPGAAAPQPAAGKDTAVDLDVPLRAPADAARPGARPAPGGRPGAADPTQELDALAPRPQAPAPGPSAPQAAARAVEPGRPLRPAEPSSSGELPLEDVDDQLEALVRELRGEVAQAGLGGAAPPAADPAVDRLARDLLLEPAWCEDVLEALEQRGRALLVGPPYAGKTFVARRLAIHLAGHLDRVVVVRLHPELSRADLLGAGEPPGLVRELVQRAQDEREQRHVLVLDELDRGDAARALGELLGALSERGADVASGPGLSLHVPRNLYVLATARELPHDPALVGRFPIVGLPADPEVLRRFLAQRRPGLEWAADLLRTLNARLAAGDHGLAVGHGVFMDPDLDAERLRRTWRREVAPLLALHGVRADDLELDALWPAAQAGRSK